MVEVIQNVNFECKNERLRECLVTAIFVLKR
jgi:hypothetical protein